MLRRDGKKFLPSSLCLGIFSKHLLSIGLVTDGGGRDACSLKGTVPEFKEPGIWERGFSSQQAERSSCKHWVGVAGLEVYWDDLGILRADSRASEVCHLLVAEQEPYSGVQNSGLM